MKIISICDSPEMYTGLRLVGIEGGIVHRPEEFAAAYEQALSDHQAGIVVIAKSFKAYTCRTDVKTMPLIVEL